MLLATRYTRLVPVHSNLCSKLIIQNKIKASDSSKLRSRDIAKFLHYVLSQGSCPLIYLITIIIRKVFNILKLYSGDGDPMVSHLKEKTTTF